MSEETKIQKAINIIEKRPGIRTEELANAIGCEQKNLAPLLWAATSTSFIVTCKVERPGKQGTVEYRLSAGVVASGWDQWKSTHREGGPKPLKPKIAVRREPAQASKEDPTTALHRQRQADQDALLLAKKRISELESTLESTTAKLRLAEQQRDSHFETAEDYKSQLDVAEHANRHWMNLAEAHGCDCLEKLQARLESLTSGSGAANDPVDVKDAATGYLIRIPRRQPIRRNDPAVARQTAIMAAHIHGRADVVALVPIGTARGKKKIDVEWQEA